MGEHRSQRVSPTTLSDCSLPPRLGATVQPEGVFFRVWAPRAGSVEVERYTPAGPLHRALEPVGDGFFAGLVHEVGPGIRYRYRLDGGAAYPDPASRSQPEGVHGPSEVVDPAAFEWTDHAWRGLYHRREHLIIYELHVGTFSASGTFDGVIEQLPELASLGVTALELMPIAEFPGARNWGYDGVDIFAPSSVYGGPSGLKRLVDAAHGSGLGVLLDVVYNHLGPDGNYLWAYSKSYFTDRYRTPWGDAINFDGPDSEFVRAFLLENVRYWLDEYHVDGFRLDATHAIYDASRPHILAEVARVAHRREQPAIVIAEDCQNLVRLIDPPERGGDDLDGVWADDFHHLAHTYLTREQDGYYREYSGSLSDLARTIEAGFFYQGQARLSDGRPSGTRVTDQPARAFVFCLQNHDQVGNRARGERLNHLVDRQRYLLASVVLLLSPETVLLFQGQEFAASVPFLYFTDHNAELGRLVTEGRRSEFRAFSQFAHPRDRAAIPDPQAEATFLRSRLDFAEREQNADVYEVYRALLQLRRGDPVFSRSDRRATRAWASGPHALAIHRWTSDQQRLVLVNFGDEELDLAKATEGLERGDLPWRTIWSLGISPPPSEVRLDGGWRLPARATLVLGAPGLRSIGAPTDRGARPAP